jgi:multiple sugar transport system substrate-binding protein
VTHLRGLTWRHRRGISPLLATAAAYTLQHPDMTIEWDDLPWHEFWQTSVTEMSSHSGRYDLYMFDHPWVGDFAENDWLLPLDTFLTREQRDDLSADADPASYRSYTWRDQTWALPVDAACHVIVFRPDLAELSALPNDWDALLAFARTRHRPPQRYAFVAPLIGGGNALLFFLGVLAATGEPAFEDPANAAIAPERGRRALDILRQVSEMNLPPDRMRGRVYDALLQTDEAVIGASVFAYINYFGPDAARPLGIADMPVLSETGVRTSMLGGMGLGISMDCPDPQRAWDYAWYVMSKPVQSELYIENDGQPARLSALRNPSVEARTGPFLPVLRSALDGCYIRPRYPRWLEIENGAAPALEQFLQGSATADETLKALEARAQLAR